ncbi:MAG: nuclear transport factor 2 family protein [Gemmatimonadota bacterium]|nr:nuclear transport factor 2 family protein [Gemmatimonadota bacterium]
MTRALFTLMLLLPAAPLAAQTPDAVIEVRATVERLFNAMRAGDSASVRALFHPGGRIGSAVVRQSVVSVRPDPPDGFIRAVGGPRQDVWDERIADLQISVDGPLATAWMEYAFYLGDQRSHCGVNAMQLVRMAEGWQIVSLIDTRRQEGCKA